MDGSLSVFTMVAENNDDSVLLTVAQRLRTHGKYVTRVRWSHCGTYAVTISDDNTMALYDVLGSARPSKSVAHTATSAGGVPVLPEAAPTVPTVDGAGPLRLKWRGSLTGCPEAVEFEPPAPAPSVSAARAESATRVVVAVRGSDSLLYVDCATREATPVLLVDGMHGTAPSFSVTDLALCWRSRVGAPPQLLVAAATDGPCHFVYEAHTSHVVARLVGHVPPREMVNRTLRIAWGPRAEFLYCTGAPGSAVNLVSLASETVVARLQGQGAMVRDIVLCRCCGAESAGGMSNRDTGSAAGADEVFATSSTSAGAGCGAGAGAGRAEGNLPRPSASACEFGRDSLTVVVTASYDKTVRVWVPPCTE